MRCPHCGKSINVTGSPPADADGPGLFERDGAETSKDAARSVNAGTWRAKVLQLIAASGAIGVTDEEGFTRMGIDYSRWGPRRRELHNWGYVQDSGKVRPTVAGCESIIWTATGAGHAEAERLSSPDQPTT